MQSRARPYPPAFLNLLSDVLTKEESDRARQRHGGEIKHYPSSASFRKSDGSVVGACLRAAYYKATGVVETDTRDLTNYLQAGFGNSIHDWLTDKLNKSPKIKVEAEAKGSYSVEGLNKEISFRLDGLVSHNGELGGLEIKTVQSYGLQHMLKEGGPKEDHLLQILSYFATNEAIRWFCLLYVARDSGYRAEFHLWKNPETEEFMVEGIFPQSKPKPVKELTFEGVVKRWKEYEGFLERQELPPRDFKAVFRDGQVVDRRIKNHVEYQTDFKCRYCSYKTHCWTSPGWEQDQVQIGGVTNA